MQKIENNIGRPSLKITIYRIGFVQIRIISSDQLGPSIQEFLNLLRYKSTIVKKITKNIQNGRTTNALKKKNCRIIQINMEISDFNCIVLIIKLMHRVMRIWKSHIYSQIFISVLSLKISIKQQTYTWKMLILQLIRIFLCPKIMNIPNIPYSTLTRFDLIKELIIIMRKMG